MTPTPKDVLVTLPPDLPIPQDDGACAHLAGMRLPELALAGTDGRLHKLAAHPGKLVVFCYPMTGTPGRSIPDGWVQIPGAAGCTPQVCAYRDHHVALQAKGFQVFGLSVQSAEDQAEAAARLHLAYPLLSDSELRFAGALRLPTFEAGGRRLIRRLTLVAVDGVIAHVIYPVFPPGADAQAVLALEP